MTASQPLALALSGGGAKCGAQAGALAVLAEAGLRVAALTGTSGGGLVAVLYALGWAPTAIRDFIAETHLLSVWNFDPAGHGLLATAKLRARLGAAVGDCTFADLACPVVLVAADLNTGNESHLDSGRLDEALLATMAIPALFEPVCVGQQRLVDGGLLNPMPVDVALRWGCPVVAVDVLAEPPAPGTRPQLFESHGPLGYVAALGHGVGLLGALEVVNESVLVSTGRLRQDTLHAHPPAVHIRPPVGGIGLFAFDRAVEAYALGAEAARAALPQLQACAALSEPAR